MTGAPFLVSMSRGHLLGTISSLSTLHVVGTFFFSLHHVVFLGQLKRTSKLICSWVITWDSIIRLPIWGSELLV